MIVGQSLLVGMMDSMPSEVHWTRTDRKEILLLSFLINIISVGIVTNLFYIRRATEPISKNPSLLVASTFAFVSLLLGFGLMLDTMRQLMMSRWNLPFLWSKHLLCFSIMSLVFTVVSLIASFLPKTYYYIPVVLVPTLMVICMSFDHAPPEDIVAGDDPHKADRKRSFQLVVNMTTFSIMGALGALVGYHKNTSNRADQAYVKVAIYFMLSASLTGIVTLLLNRMLRSWKDWKKMAVANLIMLGLLVPAMLMVATTFLGGAVAAAPALPVAVSSATWYIMEYHHRRDDVYGQREDELKPLYGVALTAMSVSFGAVMSIFAGFLGGEAKGENLVVCIFSLVSCFVSSVVLGLVTFRPPKKASLREAAKLLYYLALLLLMLAALALVSYVG